MAARFKTFTAGSVLTASEVNTYLAKQAVINCDSSADYPSAPVVGMTVYDLDKDALLIYAGATSGWRPPWNVAWGVLDYAQVTADQTGITTITSLTTLTTTATVPANRRIRTTISGEWLGQVLNDRHIVYIADGADVALRRQILDVADADSLNPFHLSYVEATTAGSITRKARMERSSGTGACQLRASATNPAFILLEDIGPAGAPS